jgi:hypothetical protein
MSLEVSSGSDWGEKMSFTVGMSYVVGNYFLNKKI